ncbi:B-box zinc finger protein [Quillaja saponaria]|uniref:B-box zinc finger protein n=1 Tax=Quillaja saponaria TaxID=32244 RepID=A0AAD7L5Q6_QUISA|nr:B-box zinc finger protein [Quillaja saponaria]
MKATICELCEGEATVYCGSDSAFLCRNCDAGVHQANFLVARHIRQTLCSKCKGFSGNQVSGFGSGNPRPVCLSCSPEKSSGEVYSVSSCSSSACASSTESCATNPNKYRLEDHRKRTEDIVSSSSVTELYDQNSKTPAPKQKKGRRLKHISLESRAPTNFGGKAAEVFMNWSRRFGLNGNLISLLALRPLDFCLGKLTAFPFRVALATSFWWGLRFCGDMWRPTYQNLRRLEEISGVPAKLILAAEAKLARELKLKGTRREMEEGWAESECSL